MKSIRLYYISDLHLELLISSNGLSEEKLKPYEKIFQNTISKLDNNYENILLIAGDLIWSQHFHYLIAFLENIVSHFDKSFLILGNHDYWKSTISKTLKTIQNDINSSSILSQKLILLENDLISLNENYNLWGATFWYTVPPYEQYNLTKNLNDYKKIRTDHYRKTNYHFFELLHNQSLYSLKQALIKTKQENKKLVVTTHHGTSEAYLKYTDYTDCFGYGIKLPISLFNEKEPYDLIDNIQCFIHGHSHVYQKPLIYENEYNIPTYMNTLGYLHHEILFSAEDKINTINPDKYQLPYIDLSR